MEIMAATMCIKTIHGDYIDGLVQDCSALAMEMLQSGTKP